ncbi:hypothetical protein [Fuerstiella marisgermanici]|uniref:Uncharacterized protein n=1 Tax=Fuerstiella marisgermanici TaxID=1891926 RepID=A0A1P8WDC3_9PLAN|nr:hypothetical protein [Fuerstiella marisgermanici]APZ92031.1 hypothetical protein Fuma_01635 [Fuerstiella marisgermanici]
MSDAPPISKCYRPGRHWLVIGIVGGIFFQVMGITSVYVAYWNIDGSFPHPKAHALVYGVFWFLWTLIAFWLIAAYFRTCLFITPLEFTQQGCLIRRRMSVADISQIQWKGIPQAGKIILHGSDCRMKIDLDNLTAKDRTEFIEFIRSHFDHRVQTGWSDFNRYSSTAAPSPEDERRVARRCALMFSVVGIACLLCGWFALGVQFYVSGTACILATVWYAWRIRRHKRSTAG